MVANEELDVIGITETWIHTDTRDFVGEYELAGYKLFKKDRKGREGGGVMLYVKEHLNPVESKPNTFHKLLGVKIHGDECLPFL